MLTNFNNGYAPMGQYQPGQFAVNSGIQNTLLYKNVQLLVGKVTQYLASNGVIRSESRAHMPTFYADLNTVTKIAEMLSSNGVQNPWTANLDENTLAAAMYEYMKVYNGSRTQQLGQALQNNFGGFVQQPYGNNMANVYSTQQPNMQPAYTQQPTPQTFGGIPKLNQVAQQPQNPFTQQQNTFAQQNPFTQQPQQIQQEVKKPQMKLAYIPLEILEGNKEVGKPTETSKDESTNTAVVVYPDSTEPKKISDNLETIQKSLGSCKKYIVQANEKVSGALNNVAKEDIEGVVSVISKMDEKNDLFSDVVLYLSSGNAKFNVPAVGQLLTDKFNNHVDLGAFRKWWGGNIIHFANINEIISVLNNEPIDSGDTEINNLINNPSEDYKTAIKEVANKSVAFIKSITNVKKKSHAEVTYKYSKPVIFSNVDLGDVVTKIPHVGDTTVLPDDHLITQYVKMRIGDFVEFGLRLNKNNVLFYNCNAMYGDALQITRIE